MKKYRIHITAFGKFIRLSNGEKRRTPTRFVINENEKNSYLATLRALSLSKDKDFTIEEISDKEAEDTAKKLKSSSYREKSRSLKKSNGPDLGLSFKMKG